MQRRTFLTAALAAPTLDAAALNTPSEVKPFVVKAGAARFGTHTPLQEVNPNDLKVSSKDTNGQLSVFEYIGHQKIGPPLHVHHEQDEIFSILEGEYLFRVGDEQFTAKAGDTVFGPRKVPHTWVQVSDTAKMEYMFQPAGQMEDFFVKMSELKAPPTPALAQKIFREHGMDVLGPPLALK